MDSVKQEWIEGRMKGAFEKLKAHDFAATCVKTKEEAVKEIWRHVTPEMKALIDRAGMVNKANGGLFRRKVGAAVVAVRRGGMMPAFDTLNHFFLVSEMIVPGSSYWSFAIGLEKGDVEKDQEGIQTMQVLGQNMAWLIKKLYG